MKRFIVFLLVFFTLQGVHGSVNAQTAYGEVTSQPICFNLRSEAKNNVYGRVMTNYYEKADGTVARHRSNFRLQPGASHEVCTSGPFFEGRKVEIVIQTFVPVFNCKTAITGDIIFKDERNSEGTLKTWAECL